MSRQIVIGDVHGHYETLMRLLEAIAPGSGDRINFLGDLVDRGPDSAKVLDLVMNEPSYTTIRGNHEEMMLASFTNGEINEQNLQYWLMAGGRQTIDSYHNPSDIYSHLDWLKTVPLYRDLGKVWLVHAGIDPRLPIEKQSAEQFCWIRDLFHRQRQPYFQDKLIVTGHTISFTFPGVQPGQLAKGIGWLDIDTGVYTLESGWLTALDVTYHRIYQANVWQETVRSHDWDDLIVEIDPKQVKPRRFAVK
ncbi:metallophosphoesterase family protein [Baaleninema simplex]|uniref:metallophosphoesterase family protein n=1 Tax=Baaleninema simplex TaxID=2862350 RepID=UPI00034C7616|nr:metallophosphoesterase family protein [Baaleninema simplex]